MGKWLALFLCLMCVRARASIHSYERALRAVEKNQTRNDLLVYKVKARISQPRFLSPQGFRSRPVFRNLRKIAATGDELNRYFVRQYAQPLSAQEAAHVLREISRDQNIEFAYFEPRVSDAVEFKRMQNQSPRQQALQQPDIGDFESLQFYLNSAPAGVDARAGWKIPGGTGKGIRAVDVETGWDLNHFEFGPAFYSNGKNSVSTHHGSAVWGEIAAKPDGKGVTGIAFDAEFGIAGSGWSEADEFDSYPVLIAGVIEAAVAQMQSGDVLIIEQHAPLVDDYGPIEYFEPVFKILKAATDGGIHCVAAAGNGFENLDDPKFNGAFDLNQRDSGCILVGAADSHLGPRARQRSDFSDYGSRVDAFGYGEGVATSGYGDLLSGTYRGKSANYTAEFAGTSSATPMVAGAVISALGVAKEKGITVTPRQMREALRQTGTPQEGVTTERIGNLPNIPQLIRYLKLL